MRVSLAGLLLLLCSPIASAAVIPQAYYWSDINNNTISRVTTPGGPIQVIWSGGNSQASGLAIDQVNRKLYWADDSPYSAARIYRSDLDGSNVTTILSDPAPNADGVSFVYQLRLDVAHNWIYFSEQTGQTIRRCHLDGTGEQVVLQASMGSGAWDIILDYAHNYMYWDEIRSTYSVINRARLDGSQRTELFADIGFYYGMELDPNGQYLYFADAHPDQHKVRRINVDGTNPITLVNQPDGSWVVGMDLDPINNKLYWTTFNTDVPGVFRSNLNGSNIEPIAMPNLTYPLLPAAPSDVAVLLPEPGAGALAVTLLIAPLLRRSRAKSGARDGYFSIPSTLTKNAYPSAD